MHKETVKDKKSRDKTSSEEDAIIKNERLKKVN